MINSKNIHLYLLALIFILIRFIFMIKNDLIVEEAYYWNYAQHLDFSYLDHPPMVAWLIKFGTFLFGNKEWAVRFMAVPCWLITAIFSFKLSEKICQNSGAYAVLLLSMLPFYFIYSMVMTPDTPLMACWSAALYFLFKAIVCKQQRSWYWAGLSIGLGLISKYTIVLLGPVTIIFLLATPKLRFWFSCKEPYLCALTALLIFSPVLYWNANHEWASFIFQSSRRFQDHYEFTLPEFLGLLFAFLTPSGLISMWLLIKNKPNKSDTAIIFLKTYTFIPLSFFLLFSLFHAIRFNWIGPVLLSAMPWLAATLSNNNMLWFLSAKKSWALTIAVMLSIYLISFFCLYSGLPEQTNKLLFCKLISWREATKQVVEISQGIEKDYGKKPVIAPLDTYNIASELIFYQNQLWNSKNIQTTYRVYGADIFGINSLMYEYWTPADAFDDKIVLLISQNPNSFKWPLVTKLVKPMTSIKSFSSVNQTQNLSCSYLYYQVGYINQKIQS